MPTDSETRTYAQVAFLTSHEGSYVAGMYKWDKLEDPQRQRWFYLAREALKAIREHEPVVVSDHLVDGERRLTRLASVAARLHIPQRTLKMMWLLNQGLSFNDVGAHIINENTHRPGVTGVVVRGRIDKTFRKFINERHFSFENWAYDLDKSTIMLTILSKYVQVVESNIASRAAFTERHPEVVEIESVLSRKAPADEWADLNGIGCQLS